MAKAPRNKATTAVYLVLEKEGKILVARRCNTGYQDGNYQIPAGHVDAGELPMDALIREAREEIGIDLKKEDVHFAHVSFREMHDETGDRVDFFFRANEWGGEVTNMEPHKCDDLQWVTLIDLPENMSPHVRIALECIGRGELSSELSLEYLKSTGEYEITL